MAPRPVPTPELKATIAAVKKHGDQIKAAAAMGHSPATINRRLKEAKRRGLPGAEYISPVSDRRPVTEAEKDRKIVFQADRRRHGRPQSCPTQPRIPATCCTSLRARLPRTWTSWTPS